MCTSVKVILVQRPVQLPCHSSSNSLGLPNVCCPEVIMVSYSILSDGILQGCPDIQIVMSINSLLDLVVARPLEADHAHQVLVNVLSEPHPQGPEPLPLASWEVIPCEDPHPTSIGVVVPILQARPTQGLGIRHEWTYPHLVRPSMGHAHSDPPQGRMCLHTQQVRTVVHRSDCQEILFTWPAITIVIISNRFLRFLQVVLL